MQAQSVLSSSDRWKHKALSNSKAEVTLLEVTSVGIVLDLSPWTMQDSSEVQDCNRPQCENEAEVIPSDYCAWRVQTCTRNNLHGSLGVCIASLKTSAAYISLKGIACCVGPWFANSLQSFEPQLIGRSRSIEQKAWPPSNRQVMDHWHSQHGVFHLLLCLIPR